VTQTSVFQIRTIVGISFLLNYLADDLLRI